MLKIYRFILPIIVLIICILFICEYLIYFLILCRCSWPKINQASQNVRDGETQLKSFVLADLHLLGRRKGHWFDKLRREWQMYRAYQTALWFFEPEVIFILGDILDEGSFSPDGVYDAYMKTFFTLFAVPNNTEVFVVPGNHDIGFHYAMTPYLEYRFGKYTNSSSVQLITKKNVHFILLNSMALEGDGCYICHEAEDTINFIAAALRCANRTGRCYKGMPVKNYSKPIIMQHFPMYRESDFNCNELDEAPYREKNTKFKQRWDCLSKDSTIFLLEKLKPRVIFSGHTHHGCRTIHYENIPEYSISSFSWRNKPNPSFAMVVFTPEEYALYKCFLPSEYTVISIYAIAIILIIFYIFYYRQIFRTFNRLSNFLLVKRNLLKNR